MLAASQGIAFGGLTTANRLKPSAPQNNEILKRKEPEQKPQTNIYDISPESLNAQIAAAGVTNSIAQAGTETLGTMAYTGSGAESAGTMASAGSAVSSASCVA